MKKTQTTLDRATAVEFLNKFFDKIGVDESNRINPNLDESEKQTIKSMREEKCTEAEIKDFTERCDVSREIIITAIRKGFIVFDDNFSITQKLKYPVESSEESLCAKELKYKDMYKVKDVVKSVAGIKNETGAERIVRTISLRTGVKKMVIEELVNCDAELANLIEGLFSKADLPMKD